MTNLKLCLLAFSIVILSGKLSVSEALPKIEPGLPEHKSAVLSFLETVWKIILSPFMLFFASLDYATELGERSGAFLQNWYTSHVASGPTTALPETNEIPLFLQNTPQPGQKVQKDKKKDNILHRIDAWLRAKIEALKKQQNKTFTSSNITDWQYPSDLSEESSQETLDNGINWFLSPKLINVSDTTNSENQTKQNINDTITPSNVTYERQGSRILAAAGRARDTVVEKLHNLGAKGRLAYDWVLWKIIARHRALPTFFGKANSTDGRILANSSNTNFNFDSLANFTSFVCDDIPSPVCAIDNNKGFTIFLNPCKMSVFNHEHQTNFTVYSTDVCMELFIKYPDKFYQSKNDKTI